MNAEEHAATENLRLGDLSEAQVAKNDANPVSESLKTESYASTVESSSVKTSSTASEVMSKSEKAKSVAAQKIDSLRAGVRQSEKDLWISKLEAKSIRTEYRELKIAQEDYAMQLRLVKASKGLSEEKIAAMQSKLVELESKVKATVTSKNQRYAAALEDVKKNELAVAGAKAKLNVNTGMFERISSKLQSMIKPATVTQEQELAKLRLDFQTALSDVNVGRRLDEKAQAHFKRFCAIRLLTRKKTSAKHWTRTILRLKLHMHDRQI
jgi:hypothetical protein